MIIKMVNEFKLTVVHFARPNAQTRCRSVDAREFTAGQKNCGKSELVHRAAGPSQAVGRGPAFCKTHFKCKERESLHRQFQKLVRSFFQQLSRSPKNMERKSHN